MTEEEVNRLMHLFDLAIAGIKCAAPVNLPGFPFHSSMSAGRQLKKHCGTFADRRRSALQRSGMPTCMLDALLLEGMSDAELADNCVTMMLAGHDTTAASTHSILYRLKQLPKLETELRMEVDKIWDGVSPITRSHLEAMPRTSSFLQEVWRSAPPISFIARKLKEDVEADGFVVPRGHVVVGDTASIVCYWLL